MNRARLREHDKPDCERRKIARRRTEEERAEAFFPLRETTTAADSTRDCASNHKQIGGCRSSRYAKRAPVLTNTLQVPSRTPLQVWDRLETPSTAGLAPNIAPHILGTRGKCAAT